MPILQKNEKREFYSSFLRLALPIIIQNLISASLYIVDTIMVGQLGEIPLAAVSQANQLSYILQLFLFGMASGAAVFGAQFWGARDIQGVNAAFTLATFFSVGISLPFLLAGTILPHTVLDLYTQDAEVAKLGAAYLFIVALSYPLQAINGTYSSILRSTGSVRLPMLAAIVSIIINTTCNYILIFGKFGVPALGIAGAAIATSFACLCHTLVLVIGGRLYQDTLRFSLTALRETGGKKFVGYYLRIAFPVLINDGVWGVGTSIYWIVYGQMGTAVVAAMGIFGTVERILFVVGACAGSACAVMVGQRIGEDSIAKAYDTGKLFLKISIALGAGIGLCMLPFRQWIGPIYNVSEEVNAAIGGVMLVYCLTLGVRYFTFSCELGCLRAGGDTTFVMILDLLGVWCVGLPAMAIGAIFFHLDISWVYFLLTLDEIVRCIVSFFRFRSRRWINNLISSKKENVPS